MENYIVINGKKAELTEEQIEKLGIKVEKDIFQRGEYVKYFFIDYDGTVESDTDEGSSVDTDYFKIANYCTDKTLMEQRALHETLNRLLWRYSMQHGGDKLRIGSGQRFCIYFDVLNNEWSTSQVCVAYVYPGEIYFPTKEIANNAIEEIVKPFMKQHPEFAW